MGCLCMEGLVAAGVSVSVSLGVDVLDGGDIDNLDVSLGLLVLRRLLELGSWGYRSGIDLEFLCVGVLDRSR